MSVTTVTVATVTSVMTVAAVVAVAVAAVVDNLGGAAVVRGSLCALSAVAIPVSLGSALADGRGTEDVSVFAPSLGAPLVVVLVVPFVIGLSIVGLGPGLVVRLVNGEVLVTAPSVPM